MKVSNKFTLARLIFAPVFFLIYSIPVWTKNPTAAFISALIMIPLLAVVQMTDYWDGHYARKNGEVSDFGKLFDPFADVMLNLTAFVCAMNSFDSKMNSYMPALFFILIMYREFSQSFLRMLATKQGVAIAARKGGKIKTVFYIISTFFMLTAESAIRLGLVSFISEKTGIETGVFYGWFRAVIYSLYFICVLLSYVSFFDYIKSFKSIFKDVGL